MLLKFLLIIYDTYVHNCNWNEIKLKVSYLKNIYILLTFILVLSYSNLFCLFVIYKIILFCYLLFIVSSEEENMNYEEIEKSQELIDEEIEHASNQEDSPKLLDVSSGDNDRESTSGNIHLILS